MQVKKALITFLAVCAAISAGALSFLGIFVYTVSQPLLYAGFAFAFATVVEWQVFQTGITNAFRRIFSDLYLERIVIRRFLREKIAKKGTQHSSSEDIFLNEYESLTNHLKNLNQHQADLEEIQETERLLRVLERKAWEVISTYQTSNAIFRTFGEEGRTQILSEIATKKKLAWIPIVLAIGGSVATLFATMWTLYAGMLEANLILVVPSLPLLSGIVILSLFASIGVFFILYDKISDVIEKHVPGTRYLASFLPGENESLGKYCVRGFAFLLSVAATLSIVGTWWGAVKKGALLIKGLGAPVAKAIQWICIPLMGLANLIFISANSVESVNKIAKRSSLSKYIEETYGKERWWEFFNPFRFLSLLFQIILFLFHCVSVGLGMDRVLGVPPSLCTLIGALSEFFTDLNYIPDLFLPHATDGEDGHEHSNIIKYVAFPFDLLAFGWDLFWGTLLTNDYSVEKCFEKHFSTHPHDHHAHHSHPEEKSISQQNEHHAHFPPVSEAKAMPRFTVTQAILIESLNKRCEKKIAKMETECSSCFSTVTPNDLQAIREFQSSLQNPISFKPSYEQPYSDTQSNSCFFNQSSAQSFQRRIEYSRRLITGTLSF